MPSLAVLGVLGLVGGAYALAGWPRVIAHELVCLVCHGTSSGKIVFALCVLGLIAAATIVMSQAEPREHVDPRRRERRMWIALVCVLGLGHGLALLSAYVYTRQLGLAAAVPSFHWSGGVNSVTSITHIHTSKTVIARALEMVGATGLGQRFDTGAPFVPFVPAWLAWAIGACFAGALVMSVRVCARAVVRYPVREQAWVLIAMGGACACCVKGVLDGGPLGYDVVVGGLTLAACGSAASIAEMARFVRAQWKRGVGVFVIWISALVALASPQAALVQIERGLERAALVVALLSVPIVAAWVIRRLRNEVARGASEGVLRWRVWRIAGVLVAWGLVVSQCVRVVRGTIVPLVSRAPERAVVFAGEMPTIVATGPSDMRGGASVLAAYRSLGEAPMRARRVSMAPKDAARSGVLYADVVVVRAAGPIAFTPGRVVSVRASEPVLEEDEVGGPPPVSGDASVRQQAYRLRVKFAFDGDLGPSLSADVAGPTQVGENERFVTYFLLDAYLRARNVEEYVLVPVVQGTEPAAAQACAGE